MTTSRRTDPSLIPTKEEIRRAMCGRRGPETVRPSTGERLDGAEASDARRDHDRKVSQVIAQRADFERVKSIRTKALVVRKRAEYEASKPVTFVAWMPADASDRIWSVLSKRMPSDVDINRNGKTVISMVCPKEHSDDVSNMLERCGLKWGEE